ncbi:hypothetical protein FHX56_005982 [Paraburkholderia tropica]|nr:hypothetical protein [Paraburkholderia tropica]
MISMSFRKTPTRSRSRETLMSGERKSLRALVNDWLGHSGHFRVTRPGRTKKMPWRVVKVEVARASGTFEIVFFRHDDGSWCVYPPTPPLFARPAVNWLCHQP